MAKNALSEMGALGGNEARWQWLQGCFVLSACVVLVLTGIAKFLSADSDSGILLRPDPIFGLPFGRLFFMVAVAEVLAGTLCFLGRWPHFCTLAVTWLPTGSLLYRPGKCFEQIEMTAFFSIDSVWKRGASKEADFATRSKDSRGGSNTCGFDGGDCVGINCQSADSSLPLARSLSPRRVVSAYSYALVATCLTVILFSSFRVQAQLPHGRPPSMEMETVSFTELLGRYPPHPAASMNVDTVKNYLSGDPGPAMRLSAHTENVMTRDILRRQIEEASGEHSRASIPHYQINFSPAQFVVQSLNCPPANYSLAQWDYLAPEWRSDISGLFDGTYYFFDYRQRTLATMDLGGLEAFEQALFEELSKHPPSHWLMSNTRGKFREYARYRNLGHEGVRPGSYSFQEDKFSCLAFNGERLQGRIYVNEAGLVERIDYHRETGGGIRGFLLFYDVLHPGSPWYPSRILSVRDRGNGKFEVRGRHTIHAAQEFPGSTLPIPGSWEELFQGIEAARVIEFTHDTAHVTDETGRRPAPALVDIQYEPIPRNRSLAPLLILVALAILPLIAFGRWFYLKEKNNNVN